MAIPERFRPDHPFTDGFAVAKQSDGKMVVLNREGQVLIESDDTILPLGRGRFAVLSNPLRIVDLFSPFKMEGQYSRSLWPFQEGLLPVCKNDKWGYLDERGKLAIPARYDATYGFTEGSAVAVMKGKWGFIDHEGEWAIEPKFDRAAPFSEGQEKVSGTDLCLSW